MSRVATAWRPRALEWATRKGSQGAAAARAGRGAECGLLEEVEAAGGAEGAAGAGAAVDRALASFSSVACFGARSDAAAGFVIISGIEATFDSGAAEERLLSEDRKQGQLRLDNSQLCDQLNLGARG